MSNAALAELAAAARPPLGTSVTATPERFSLLLLDDGEYYFRSHTAYYWTHDGKRVVGSLKVCSHSLFFVPREVQQPIFRIPFHSTSAIEPLEEAAPNSGGEDQFVVAASTHVDMKAGGVDAPYVTHKGDTTRFRFSLVYASLEEALPLVEELALLASVAADSKQSRAEAAAKLEEIIKDHEEAEQFHSGWLEEEESLVVEAAAAAVSPLAAQPGRAVLTQQRIYFQPSSSSVCAAPLQVYPLSKVVAVAPRVYQLEDLGLEVFLSSRHSLYLAFRTPADRARFQRLLMQQPALQLDKMRSREQWTRDWVNGRISNFDYLMHLNREAGRSFKDLSQYPVMPWVVADYSSSTLDLTDPATFRDLSKPIGALTPRRLTEFQGRYAELKQMMGPPPGGGGGSKGKGGKNGSKAPPPGAPPPLDTPPFLYGCHYSSPGYVVFYLMRSDPQLMLRLQNGRFDAPDRLFWSIADCWKSVLSLPSDVKELIPEFYSTDPSFLLNQGGIDFGCRSNGQRVGDVVLPPWASNARDFLWKLREALEAPHVSARLHKWIDLIFGRKARGVRAEKANNVFHYLTYDEVALKWLESEGDPAMRDALRLQMMEFGRTPRQLFTAKHPKRRVVGGGGVLSCFTCFVPTASPPPRATNQLTGKPYDVRSIEPVSRAVFKLSCTTQRDKRQALLQFLEHAAAAGEPEALTLRQTRGAELFLLVKAVRDARQKRPGVVSHPEEMLEDAVRALAVLAGCPPNRRYILEAGCLDVVVEALGSAQPALVTQAVQTLALLSREQSPRLQALDPRVLEQLLCLLRQPPSADALLAALTAVNYLSDGYASHRAFFARHDLLDLLLQQLHSSSLQSAAASPCPSPAMTMLPDSPGATSLRPESRAGLMAGHRTESRAIRRRTYAAHAADGPLGVQPALLRRQRLLALAGVLQDEPQKEAFMASSMGLHALLDDCSSDSVAVRSGAYECLVPLTASDAARQQFKELHLLPLLLEGASCGATLVEQPAAAAVANLCTDPPLVLAELAEHPGLAPVVALALSGNDEVQRSAAMALWHLSVHPEARARAVEAGALNALLSLALQPRNVVARDLARQALLRCTADDEVTRARLEGVASAQRMDPAQLAVLLTPSSARSLASSTLRKARHRKMNSEVPSSLSGAISRTSSFRSAAEGSPAFSNPARAAQAADSWMCHSASQSPMPSLLAASEAGPAAGLPPANGSHADKASGGTSNGVQQQQQQQPQRQQKAPPLSPLQLPEEPLLLPLPIITLVSAAPPASPSPIATKEPDPTPAATAPQQQQRRQAARVRGSLAAEEAATSSPRGAVAQRVQQLERMNSSTSQP